MRNYLNNIVVNVSSEDKKEYNFDQSNIHFNTGDSYDLFDGTPVYKLNGAIASSCGIKCTFLYRIKNYYYIKMESNDTIYICPNMHYYIDSNNNEINKEPVPISIQVGFVLYLFAMAFGIILHERIAWWIFCSIIFFSWKTKKIGGKKNG